MTNLNINAINFSYSPNNRFAREYQYARRQFINADYRLKNSRPNSLEQYMALLRNSEIWSKRTKDIAQRANREQKRLDMIEQIQQKSKLGNKLDYWA
jgi:hypothetical protein